MAASSKPKTLTLYCRNFPAELKKRCDGLAGFLGKSITDFVAEILEEETKEMIEHHEAAKRWYEAKSKKRNRA
jgi:predicted DNA-binding protein